MTFKTIPINLKLLIISVLCMGAIGVLEQFKNPTIADASRTPATVSVGRK